MARGLQRDARRVRVGFVELTPVNDNVRGDLLWPEATSLTLRPKERQLDMESFLFKRRKTTRRNRKVSLWREGNEIKLAFYTHEVKKKKLKRTRQGLLLMYGIKSLRVWYRH
jgi:hypothetical protein